MDLMVALPWSVLPRDVLLSVSVRYIELFLSPVKDGIPAMFGACEAPPSSPKGRNRPNTTLA